MGRGAGDERGGGIKRHRARLADKASGAGLTRMGGERRPIDAEERRDGEHEDEHWQQGPEQRREWRQREADEKPAREKPGAVPAEPCENGEDHLGRFLQNEALVRSGCISTARPSTRSG